MEERSLNQDFMENCVIGVYLLYWISIESKSSQTYVLYLSLYPKNNGTMIYIMYIYILSYLK